MQELNDDMECLCSTARGRKYSPDYSCYVEPKKGPPSFGHPQLFLATSASVNAAKDIRTRTDMSYSLKSLKGVM